MFHHGWCCALMVMWCRLPLAAAEPAALDIATILGEYQTAYQRVAAAQRSTLHWGREVTIFINRDAVRYRDNVRRGIAERAGEVVDGFVPYDPGTVVVKEHRIVSGGEPDSWSLMIRLPKAAPIGGPWRYIELAADRRVLLDGTGADPQVLTRCAVCHQQISARDYLFHSFADVSAQPATEGTP